MGTDRHSRRPRRPRRTRRTRRAPRGLVAAVLAAAALLAVARPAQAAPQPYLDLPGDLLVPVAAAESMRIVINVPGRTLSLVEGPRLVARYPVAVGRPGTPTPQGTFRILQMAKDPTWAPRGGRVVPPGPDNPLGSRWMRITADGYGIHATNDPASIGHARSKGCIRMLPADAEAVFARVGRGTRVDIVYELEGWDEQAAAVRFPDLYAQVAGSLP
jgi:lipoprotein-anchoring transpeptidase ErfK/SrfK